jgi:hypothetical protein
VKLGTHHTKKMAIRKNAGRQAMALIKMGESGYKVSSLSGNRRSRWTFQEKPSDINHLRCGCSSEVERQLPKLNVVGSIPIARSNFTENR